MIHSKKELKNTRDTMPKISVLMPVYNTPEKYLRVATEIQQNMLDFLTKDLNKQKQIKLTLCDDKRWFKIGLPLLSVAVSKTYIGVFIFGCIKIFSKKRLRK